MSLKYLFEVEYTDGSIFKQNKEDVSPEDNKRSSFHYVLSTGKQIKKFSLKRFLETWSIDLVTGIFSHNEIEFQQEWNLKAEKRELIYQRQREQDSTATFNKKTGQILKMEQTGPTRTKYFIGYKVGEKEYIIGFK